MTAPLPPRVAFQGDHGAFSEEAARAACGAGASLLPCATLEDLFACIEADGADLAVAPVENTLFGAVQRSYDLLLASRLHVVGERVVRVRHQLIACAGAAFAGLKTVESPPVALGQCERSLAAHPHLARAASDDTAASVRRVCALGDPGRAAIGSRRAARLYGGTVLRRNIEDHPRNFTRFLLLARTPAAPPPAPTAGRRPDASGAPRPKVALAVWLDHAPGTLHRALEPFARRGIDLLRLESRPIPGEPWHYLFFLDLLATPADPAVRDALADLAGRARAVRTLGCFLAAPGAIAAPGAVATAGAATAGAAAAPRRASFAAAVPAALTSSTASGANRAALPDRPGKKADHVA